MKQIIQKITNDIFIVSFELFKIMIPTLILVKIAEIYGLVSVLTNFFGPITTMMGLPAEMALAITTTMLTNPYAGLIVLSSCLLYTSPSPRDVEESRMPSSA